MSAPLRIWLQWYGDGDPKDPGEVAHSDVTWAADKINKSDVAYVKASVASGLLAELKNIKQFCEGLSEGNDDQMDAIAGMCKRAIKEAKQ